MQFKRNGVMRLRPALHMRVTTEKRGKNLNQLYAPLVQRLERDRSIAPHDLNRRSDSSNIPARIALRIFIAGREIRAAFGTKPFQQLPEPPPIRSLRAGSGDTYTGGRVVEQLRHET